MAISFVAAGAVSTGANPAVALPAGTAAGDLLVLITIGTNTPSAVGSGNWNAISTQGATNFVSVFTRFAAATETGTTAVTLSGTSSKAVMLAYRGVGYYDVISAYNTGTGASPATLSQTTGFTNDYVVSIYGTSSGASRTWTAPGSTTSRVNSASTTTIAGMLIVDELQAAAGASATRTATLSGSNQWSAVSISIREPRTCYWVGGNGTWSGTTKTNWATSSGGTAGTIVPGNDDVVFDANSNTGTTAFTVTASTTTWGTCNNFSTSSLDAIMTLAFVTTNNYGIKCLGNFTAPATNFAITPASPSSSSGTLSFVPLASQTFTPNAQTFSNIEVDGRGGTLSLGGALTCHAFNLIAGTFTTTASNYALTAGGSVLAATVVSGTLTLNGSTVTVSGSQFGNGSTTTALTLNAGTSTINMSVLSPTFYGMGKTYNNVSFTSTSLNTINFSGTTTTTFANLTIAARTNPYTVITTLSANMTVTGTFTVQSGATDPSRRVFFRSSATGSARTITSASNNLFGVDFMDITAAGAASWTDSSRTKYWGDCKGNTGITFATGRSVYWNLGSTQNWTATAWSLTSGGSVAATNFPLAQDTAVFDNNSNPQTVTIASPVVIGTLDAATRTGTAFTFAVSSNIDYYVCGDWLLGTTINVTQTNSTSLATLIGRTTQTITTNSQAFAAGTVEIDSIGGTVQLGGNYVAATAALQDFKVTRGTFNTQNYNLTVSTFQSSSTNTRSVTLGTSTIEITNSGTNAFTLGSSGTGLTFSGASSTILFSVTSTGTVTCTAPNTVTLGTIIIGGGASTGKFDIPSNFSVNAITSTRTAAYPIDGAGAGNIMQVGSFNVSGSAGNLITLGSGTGNILAMNFTGTGVVSCDYLNVNYSTVTPSNIWYAGTHSTAGTTTTGWIFTAPPGPSNFFLLF